MNQQTNDREVAPIADTVSQSALIKALSAQIWMATAVLMSGVWAASDNRCGSILAGVWLIVAGYWYKIGKRVGT